MKVFCLAFTLMGMAALAVSISPHPIAVGVHPTNPRLMTEKKLLYIADKPRYSTCTGVAWFPENQYLITANFLDESLQFFRFDSSSANLHPIEYLSGKNGVSLSHPENIVFSRDGKWIAVPNFKSSIVNFFKTDLAKHTIDPKPALLFRQGDEKQIHGARFSHDSRYFAYVTIDNPGRIFIYRIQNGDPIRFQLTQCLDNPMFPLKPKAIDFSPNGRFIAVAYAVKASMKARSDGQCIATYSFDSNLGQMNPNALSVSTENLCVPDDLHFYKDSASIFATNQGCDTVSIHDVNPDTGIIGESRVALQNPEADLSFPHGFSFSWDYKYLAVSNYGGSRLLIYEVEP